MITKKLIQIGNSWGIVIPKAIIDVMNISSEDELELYLENGEIRLRKIKKD